MKLKRSIVKLLNSSPILFLIVVEVMVSSERLIILSYLYETNRITIIVTKVLSRNPGTDPLYYFFPDAYYPNKLIGIANMSKLATL